MRTLVATIALISCLPIAASATPHEISGRASVIDGDTIEIRGQNLRLGGIDAPESGQQCERDNRPFRCGQQAALFLYQMIGKETVTCHYDKLDKYKRPIVTCRTATTDLNKTMVGSGWAVAAYGKTYLDEEKNARAKRLGLWAGTFTPPAEYRHGPTAEERAAQGDCLIKGNINSKGVKLYHLPQTPGYGKTKVDTAQGERWFCSPQEAERAGWRKAGTR